MSERKAMRVERSATQILFGHLPGQTIDMHGGVWKVIEWRNPRYQRVDSTALRNELLRLARPWVATDRDGGFVRRLQSGDPIRVLSVDLANGVSVERFPEVFQCRVCNRIPKKRTKECVCGASSWGQLHFVGYHTCGEIQEPWIPRCKAHDQVKVVFPGSSDARQIRFVCPVCNAELRRGFGFNQCSCGNGTLLYNVHRAASVFTPRSFAIVNAMSPEKVAAIRAAGGEERALAWVLDGMPESGMEGVLVDIDSLIDDLVAKGIDRKIAERMASLGAAEGAVATTAPTEGLPTGGTVLDEAVMIVSAVSESRLTPQNLIERTDEHDTIGRKYRAAYTLAIARAGLESIELIDRFPVLTGHYGYTRGDQDPGAARLRTWRDSRTRQQVVYADLQETEALFVRLDPMRVQRWLADRGHLIGPATNNKEARRAILQCAIPPAPGTEIDAPSAGADLLTLVHSYSHRMIRQLSVLAGLDRNSLAELLVPSHAGFFVYAAARGDFVLGGLQAVFETELDRLLAEFVGGEHRCAMDPGCTKTGAACVACLHVGEPSCRYFNRFLDRRTLIGPAGYLRGG
jgi:hypothetical protein